MLGARETPRRVVYPPRWERCGGGIQEYSRLHRSKPPWPGQRVLWRCLNSYEKPPSYLRFGRPKGGLPSGVLPPPKYHSEPCLCAIVSTGCCFQSEKNSLMSFCSKRCSKVAVTMQVRRVSSPSA